MTAQPTPTALLLATDLSARSDRALARAVQLARHWNARLVAVVALSEDADFSLPNRSQDAGDTGDIPPEPPAVYLERMARRDLADAGIPIEVRVVVGDPGPVALAVARETGCGLIVSGSARSDASMRKDPGSTVRWLSHHSEIPVLAVNDRVHGTYRHVTVASDYSDPASEALRLADGWFSDATARTLLHGYEVPLTTLALNDAPRAQALEVAREQADAAAAQHLADVLGPAATRWQAVARLAGPVRLLRQHARDHATDLTVIASHGRSGLMDRLLGSVADRLLETVGTDLLLVRPTR